MLSPTKLKVGESTRDQRAKPCKHKWDQSLWMTHKQSLWSSRITASALFACHAAPRLENPWDSKLRLLTRPPHLKTPPKVFLPRQHTTSNGHHRDEWIFCLVCPQCGLLRRPRILTLSECFTGTLTRSWHKTTRGLAWSANTVAAEGRSGGEMLPEKKCKKTCLKWCTKELVSSANTTRGSRDHYPRGSDFLFWHAQCIPAEKKKHGRHIRAPSKPRVIERLQTLYSHLSTHAKSSRNVY